MDFNKPFKNLTLFRRTRALEHQLEVFLDRLSQSALIFNLGLRIYLREGVCPEFQERLQAVSQLESEADQLRRAIERELYSHTLIPESRGDVLGLLENLDSVHNVLEGTLWGFSIEKPDIPETLKGGFQDLTEMAAAAVEVLVLASRQFFRNGGDVADHLHKVLFYEKEADRASTRLKRDLFAMDVPLSRKLHLRYFVEHIDDVADRSEDVADRLAIYAIKRKV